MAREPGHRSKIAVSSNEPGVDPVGACVGAKGSRVRMVVNELRGEKIDVVEWSDDASRFVGKALAPATVKDVRIDADTQTALVVVPDFQLSLAIGKEGQNARLAARLTGWRIDIKSESQVSEEQAAARSERAATTEPEASGEAEEAVPAAADEEPAGQATESPSDNGAGDEEVPVAEEPVAEEEATDPEQVAPGEPSPQTISAAPGEGESSEGGNEG